MNLLETPLPQLTLRPDVDPSHFFDRCEVIAQSRGWGIDRRRNFSGEGFDQLNIELRDDAEGYPILRMVFIPRDKRMAFMPRDKSRLSLDVIARWTSHPVDYDEYLNTARAAYARLLHDYATRYARRLKLGISRRPEALDLNALDCNRIEYAEGKFREAVRSLAVGSGDVRQRLRSVFSIIHVVQPQDLPSPVRSHLEWVYHQMSWRQARYEQEGTLDATLAQMQNRTGVKIARRILALADALEVLVSICGKRRQGDLGLPI